jgi:hypothetical protein
LYSNFRDRTLARIGEFIKRGEDLKKKVESGEDPDNLNDDWATWFQDTRQWLGIHLSMAHESSFDRVFVVQQNPPKEMAAKKLSFQTRTSNQIAVLQRFQKKLAAYGMPVAAPPGSRCAYPVPVTTTAAQPVNNQYAYGIRVSFKNPHGIFAFTNYQIWTKGAIRMMIPSAENHPAMMANWANSNGPNYQGFLGVQSDIPAGMPLNIEIYSDAPIDLECIDEIP